MDPTDWKITSRGLQHYLSIADEADRAFIISVLRLMRREGGGKQARCA